MVLTHTPREKHRHTGTVTKKKKKSSSAEMRVARARCGEHAQHHIGTRKDQAQKEGDRECERASERDEGRGRADGFESTAVAPRVEAFDIAQPRRVNVKF